MLRFKCPFNVFFVFLSFFKKETTLWTFKEFAIYPVLNVPSMCISSCGKLFQLFERRIQLFERVMQLFERLIFGIIETLKSYP